MEGRVREQHSPQDSTIETKQKKTIHRSRLCVCVAEGKLQLAVTECVTQKSLVPFVQWWFCVSVRVAGTVSVHC